jgi:hypothetical protein
MTQIGHPDRSMACPRCGAAIGPDQDWCLTCGAAARTRIATTPRWQTPVIALFCVLAIALAGLGYAFADLTADAGRLAPAPTSPAPGAVQPQPTQQPLNPLQTATTPPPVNSQPELPPITTQQDATPPVPDPSGGALPLPAG